MARVEIYTKAFCSYCSRAQRLFARHVEQHDYEQKEHHDGAGVDDDLDHRDKRRVEEDVEPGQAEKRPDEQQDAVDGVRLHDDEQRRAGGDRREEVEEDQIKVQSRALRRRSRAG